MKATLGKFCKAVAKRKQKAIKERKPPNIHLLWKITKNGFFNVIGARTVLTGNCILKPPDRNKVERGGFTMNESLTEMWVKEGLHYVQNISPENISSEM
jgi:hypothetical protein